MLRCIVARESAGGDFYEVALAALKTEVRPFSWLATHLAVIHDVRRCTAGTGGDFDLENDFDCVAALSTVLRRPRAEFTGFTGSGRNIESIL